MNAVSDNFSEGDWIIYPKHGLGKTLGFEKQVLSESEVEFIVVYFESENMTLRIPLNKADELGVRSISDESAMKAALTALRGKKKIRRTMWAKREKDYKDKAWFKFDVVGTIKDFFDGAIKLIEGFLTMNPEKMKEGLAKMWGAFTGAVDWLWQLILRPALDFIAKNVCF